VNLILLGMKHSGKSKLGRMLAERLGARFVDVDDRIELVYHDRTGERVSVREVFGAVGEHEFGHLEAQAVALLAEELAGRGSNAVVALGGRTPLNREATQHLRKLGPALYLKVDPQTLWDRVVRKGVPPFLDPSDPRADFFRLCRDREPAYEAMASVTVELDGVAPPGENLGRILSAVEGLKHAG
jgi:shikimate kinase